jgi:hypothetical protein
MHALPDFVNSTSKPFAARATWRRWKDKMVVKYVNDINTGQIVVASTSIAGVLVMVGIYWAGFVQLQKDVADIKQSLVGLPVWVSNQAQLEKRVDQDGARLDAQSQRLSDVIQAQAVLQQKMDDIMRASHITPDRSPDRR